MFDTDQLIGLTNSDADLIIAKHPDRFMLSVALTDERVYLSNAFRVTLVLKAGLVVEVIQECR
jgi:hypothetical protein